MISRSKIDLQTQVAHARVGIAECGRTIAACIRRPAVGTHPRAVKEDAEGAAWNLDVAKVALAQTTGGAA